MNAISSPFYQEVVDRLNQMTIRGNRHKVSVFVNLSPDHQLPTGGGLTEVNGATTAFAFHIMFERNNVDSAWRLVTPLKFVR